MYGFERNTGLFFADALRDIFGINSPIYIPYGKNIPYQAGQYEGVNFLPEESDEIEIFSQFGCPVMGVIQFEGGEYNIYNRMTGAVEKGRFADYRLPFSCIAEFSRNAHITKTNVLGNTGTVKELFGLEDWNITIRGLAMTARDGSGADAHEQIESLTKWAGISDSIGIEGSMFRRKEIYNIVIQSINVQPVVGRWDAIPFQIDAVSDEPIELFL